MSCSAFNLMLKFYFLLFFLIQFFQHLFSVLLFEYDVTFIWKQIVACNGFCLVESFCFYTSAILERHYFVISVMCFYVHFEHRLSFELKTHTHMYQQNSTLITRIACKMSINERWHAIKIKIKLLRFDLVLVENCIV